MASLQFRCENAESSNARLALLPAVLVALTLALLPSAPAQAQALPATYVGFIDNDCGRWISRIPGCWAFIDFDSPWKFFPDNGGGTSFAAFIPQGEVLLDTDSVIDDTGVVIPFLGISVSTLAIGSEAHLTIATAGSLTIDGLGGVGGLITNDGRISLQGSAVLETPFVTQLLGGGEIVLDGESSVFRSLLLLSHANDHTIRGHGNIIAASLLNEGRIVADRDERALNITGAQLTNTGLLRAGGLLAGVPGGELRLSPVLLGNSGAIVAEDGFIKIEDSAITNPGLIEARALGTIVLQDVTIDGGGGVVAVRTGGAIAFNGNNRVDGGTLDAAAGTEIAIGPGETTFRRDIDLQGLLATRGGTVRFDGVDLRMANGTVEIGDGVVATAIGGMSSFRGGRWQGGGLLDARTATRWDGTTSIHNAGVGITLNTASHRALGTIRNEAVISLVNNSGFNQTSSLLLEGDLTLDGNGSLLMRGTNGPVRIGGAVANVTLHNTAAHLIRVEAGGNATIDVDVVNDGTLETRGSNSQLFMPVAQLRNRGLLGAFDGGVLTLRDGPSGVALIHNTGGRIEAGEGSRVSFFNVHPSGERTTIRGGTLAGSGRFDAGQRSALDGATDGAVTIAQGATVRLVPGSSLWITGEIINDGLIDLADTTDFTSGGGTLLVHESAALNGAGRTLFTRLNEMQIRGTSAAARLHVGALQTVGTQGALLGTIHVDVTNAGRVEARGANATLALPIVNIRNTGVLGAYAGGVLTLRDTGTIDQLVHNTGGLIEAGTGGRVDLFGSTGRLTTIRGGTLGGAGRIDAIANVLLDGTNDGAVTIAAGGTVRAGAGTNLFTSGTIVNDGLLELSDTTNHTSGGGTLWISGEVDLTGSGRTLFSRLNEMSIRGTSASALLRVGADQTVTTLADVFGAIDVAITNAGRIETRGGNSTISARSAQIRNTGLLGAFDGGVLSLGQIGSVATFVNNAGGRIEAGAGSRVTFSESHPSVNQRATVRGGLLAGSGRFETFRFVAFDGATDGALTLESGATVRVAAGTNLFLSGEIVNDGTLELADTTDHTSGGGVLWIEGTVDLTGDGRTLFSRLNEMSIRGTDASALLRVGAEQSITTLPGVFGTIAVNTHNAGRIEARGANAVVLGQVANVRNAGVLGAFDGGVLSLQDTGTVHAFIHNTGGRIEAGANSRVALSEVHPLNPLRTTIRGGTLAGSGRFSVGRTVAFDGATDGALTIAADATVRLDSGSNLFLNGSVVNHGVVDLGDSAGFLTGNGNLWIDGDVELGGTGRTVFSSGNEMRIIAATSDALLHVGEAQTITTRTNASGNVAVNLSNAGRIEARGANAFLAAATPLIRNTGLLGAFDGGVLTLRNTGTAAALIHNTGGRIEAGVGSRIVLSDGHPSVSHRTTIRGGVLAGGGRFDATRQVGFDGATDGPLTIEAGATVRADSGTNLYLSGSIVNNGLIDLGDSQGFLTGAGTLWVEGTVDLGGAGRTLFSIGNEMRIRGTDDTALLRIGANQSVVALANASGLIQVASVNAGRIETRGANSFLTIENNNVVNRGRIGAAEGGSTRVGAPLGQTIIDNRGGLLHVDVGSRLTLHGVTHPSHTGRTVVRGGVVGGTGTLATNGLVTFTDGVVFAPGNSPGVLTVEGNLALDPLGALDLELMGVTLGTEYDQLRVLGRLTLDGALRVLMPESFRPDSTTVFTLLTANELFGSFANVRDGRLDLGFGFFDVLDDRRSLRLTNFVANPRSIGVPAPTPLALLLLAGVVLVMRGQANRSIARLAN